MSILLLTEIFPPQVGGSGRWLYELYRGFPSDGIVVAAGCFPGSQEFDSGQDFRSVRLPLAFTSWGFFETTGFKQYWSTLRRISAIIRQDNITAIHCGKLLPEGWLAWMGKRLWGIPYWVFVHGEELSVCRKSKQLTWMSRRVLNAAQGIVANSRNTSNILSTEWSVRPEKLHVIHPGVDTNTFAPAPVDPSFRESQGWNNRRVLLTVSRLQKRKGHDSVIRSLTLIRQQVPDVLYVIVGDGEEREALEGLAVELNVSEAVRFVGQVSDDMMRKFYQQCDLFVLANREVGGDFEGFGMVLLEAQACGKPVIAGNTGGTRETMSVAETGFILDCDDIVRLSETISDLLLNTERRTTMGTAARRWVEKHFDWSILTQQARSLLLSRSSANENLKFEI